MPIFDHSKGIKDALSSAIDVYATKPTFDSLNIKHYRAKRIEPLKQFQVGNFTILPFDTEHDCEGAVGYLIQCEGRKILFITDSYYCKYNFTGLNHILIEANYSSEILQENINNGYNQSLANRLLKSHFSLENVKGFLKATDLRVVKDIMLIHLSEGNSDRKLFKSEIERLMGKPTYVAEKGLEIEL